MLLICTFDTWAAPSIDGGPWAVTENYGPNDAGFRIGHFFKVGALVSDPLGVPGNIVSAQADNPDSSQPDYTLTFLDIGNIFDGLYEVDPLPDYTGQMGQWEVTVVNKQGETVTASTNVLDNARVIPLARNLQVTNSTVTWDPVLFDHDNNPATGYVEVDHYEIRLLNGVRDQFYRSSTITGNSFTVPPGLLVPGQTVIRLRAIHLDNGAFFPVENRSNTFKRVPADLDPENRAIRALIIMINTLLDED